MTTDNKVGGGEWRQKNENIIQQKHINSKNIHKQTWMFESSYARRHNKPGGITLQERERASKTQDTYLIQIRNETKTFAEKEEHEKSNSENEKQKR